MESELAEIAATFDRLADQYDTRLPYFSSFAKELVRWHPPRAGSKVLDLCTGHGACLLSFPKSKRLSLTGIDISAQMLASARTRCGAAGLQVNLIKADAENLPFPDRSFDAFYCALSWQFLLRPERVALELHRIGEDRAQFALSLLGETDHTWPFLKEELAHYTPPGLIETRPACGSHQDVQTALERLGWKVDGTHQCRHEFEFSSAEQWWAWLWSHYGRRRFERVDTALLPTLTAHLLARADAVHRAVGLRIAQTVYFVRATRCQHVAIS
ncbi:class I SAM-dependent methyltransferase [Burkholderia sp. LMG 21824]|uniref:class I SAM-dependent methyltransferase n=1 Tax=Burkholderia sp. LMG 21824 TaxID=3158172 RepID=UPI003C2B532C